MKGLSFAKLLLSVPDNIAVELVHYVVVFPATERPVNGVSTYLPGRNVSASTTLPSWSTTSI